MKPNEVVPDLPAVIQTLRELQRQRVQVMKLQLMQGNGLRAAVANLAGYYAGLPEAERAKKFKEADATIAAVRAGEPHPAAPLILGTAAGLDALAALRADFERRQAKLARQLPVRAWVEQPEQRGFGLPSLAVVVGEAGDLAGYANPGKLWKRMGCAPHSFGGQTRMGSTWKSGREGSLPAAEWERYGYSPRRRSVAYLLGENLVRLNGAGPYRARWLAAKARAIQTHPEWPWKDCAKCQGAGAGCDTCGGTGRTCERAHRHGMLLATKLLLKNLWIVWTKGGGGECSGVTESVIADPALSIEGPG